MAQTEYRARVIADGASNYWPLDDPLASTVARDLVGGAHGTISGGVTRQALGVTGGPTAMTFDGTSGKIVPAALSLPGVTTVECWLNTALVAQRPVLSNYGIANGVHMCANLSGKVGYFGSTPNESLAGIKLVADGQWHHVAWALDGANGKLYVDGQFDFQGVVTRGASANLAIAWGNGEFFNGTLQDVAIYPRALTPAEVTAHYEARVKTVQLTDDDRDRFLPPIQITADDWFRIQVDHAPTVRRAYEHVDTGSPAAYLQKVVADGASNCWPLDDPLGSTVARDVIGGAHGTISGGVTLQQPGPGTAKAMAFDGTTGKIVTTANVTIPVVGTVEAWIKAPTQAEQRPLLTLPPQTPTFHVLLAGQLAVFDNTNGGLVSGLLSTTNGVWRHCVYTFNGSTSSFYVDGVLDRTMAWVRSLARTNVAHIGADPAFGDVRAWWPGSLQAIAIYPRALTPAEITAHYGAGLGLWIYAPTR